MHIMKELTRCSWAEKGFQEYLDYHDNEWGVPVYDDKIHFEFLVLEAAQAGLSWSTVLKKREGYRKAFAGFDVSRVAAFSEDDITKLISNPEIIRNQAKIRAAVNNAKRFIEVQNEFATFSKYIWSFVQGKPIVNYWKTTKEVPATTKESDDLSKDLKKRGFKFVGSTVIYAHMQAVGMVNDHLIDCFRHKELTKNEN
jgi:DNA-3-methyladenine glycosylase I